MSTKRSLIWALAISLFFSAVSLAATIHVPADQPTIQAGINAAVNGDTVLVADGTYNENIDFIGKQIVVISENGPDVTTISALNSAEAVVSMVNSELKGTIISGFTIAGGGLGGVQCEGSSPSIVNNIIRNNHNSEGNGGGGISLVGTSNSLITLNIIHDNSSETYCGAIQIGDDDLASVNDTICYNIIYNNGGIGGIRLLESSCSIFNNTISHTSYDCILSQTGSTPDVRNNILIDAGRFGIAGSGNAEYNCIWNYGVEAIDGSVTVGDGNIFTDPLFTDEQNKDYSLQIESPCIDAGDPDPYYYDRDGTRNDIGAFSYFQIIPGVSYFNYGLYAFNDTVHTLTPQFFWHYRDTAQTTQYSWHIQIGIDEDWSLIEIWDSGETISSDTFAVYAGSPLSNNVLYYLRIRVNNGFEWGGWREYQFYTHLQVLNVPSEYATIQSAIDATFRNDTVLVGPGIYEEHITISEAIALISADGSESTTLSSLYDGFSLINIDVNTLYQIIIDGFTVENVVGVPAIYSSKDLEVCIRNCIVQNNSNMGIRIKGHNLKIEDNILRHNGSYGLYTDNSNIVQISGNEVNNNGNAGIFAAGSDITVTNNIVHHNANEGIYAGPGPVYITSNIVYNNNSHGIRGNGSNSVISNNTINSNRSGIYASSFNGGTIKNNIISNCYNGYGISVYSTSDIIITYNDLFNNSSGSYYGVIPDEGNISEDPQFSGIPGNEYYLLGSSPCIDAGDPTDPVPDGGGDRIDMGALEYTGLILDFSLLTPADSTVLFTYSPTFEWEELPSGTEYGQLSYSLFIDDAEEFSSPLEYDAGISAMYSIPDPLTNYGFWHWKVKAYNDTAAFWSNEVFTFRIDYTPNLPQLISPIHGEATYTDYWLLWTESYDADTDDTVTYTLEIDNNSDFSSPEVAENGISSEPGQKDGIVGIRVQDLQDFANLQDNTVYYWRTKAVDKFGGESGFTDGTANFVLDLSNNPPNPPTAGFSPSSDFTTNNLLPTISWYPGTDPDPSDNSAALHYELWIDDDGEFETSVQFTYMTAPGTPLVILTDSLTDETHWDYIVRTIDDQDMASDWSAMQSFWTNSKNDTPMVFQANYPDAQIIYEMKPEFAWGTSVETDPLDSVFYKFYLAVDPNFQFVNIIDSIWDTTFIRVDSLAFGEEYWWKVKAVDNTNLPRFSSNVASFRTWKLGDVNSNWTVDILDIVYLVNFKFKGGPAPTPMFSGDMDGNCTINILDIVYLVNYKFKTGPEPLVGCE